MENQYSMKHIIPKIYTKQLFALSILFLFGIVVWFYGPNILPVLQAPERRFYIISVFFMAWFIKFLFFDTDTEHEYKTIPTTLIDKKIKILYGRFEGAMEFLKKTTITKQGKSITLSELPWHLLIGSSGSGKTTLLANANVNFILAKQFKKEQIKSLPLSGHCAWWATRDLVLVDVPGAHITINTQTGNILWNSLIDLIKKNRQPRALGGVVIALNLPELLRKQCLQQKKQILNEIKQCIVNLREQFGTQLPFYLVITKCDLLPGFLEYFSDCGGDELTQAWGITLPVLKSKDKIQDVFAHRFNALIKRINKQLLWRLHQERNPNARPFIKDFPLQVERLKEGITHFLKALQVPDLRLQGVYLTSAIQSNQDDSGSQLPVTINASQALQFTRYPVLAAKPYFVRQLILQGLLSSADNSSSAMPPQFTWIRPAIYAASVSAVVLSGVLLGQDFQKSIKQVYALQNDLAQYQLNMQQSTSEENHLTKALPLLDALSKATAHSNHSLSRFVNILSFYSQKSEQTASTVYQQALQTIILPAIKSDLEKFLQATNDKNPAQIYMALKAYLMLSDAQNVQADFVVSTIQQITSNTLSDKASHKLSAHIRFMFENAWQPAELDTNLIAQARRQLTSMPTTELGFVILKNIGENNLENTLNLGANIGNQPVFISKQIAKIPNLFTAKSYQAVLSEEIVTAAAETLQGNWVLGIASSAPDQDAITSLTEQLRTQYIANYVDIWEGLIANINLSTPTTLAQMQEMVSHLTNSTSPLLQLLQTVQQNTSFQPIIAASPKIQTLNALISNMQNTQQGALYPAFVSLRQLDSYLQHTLNTNDAAKSTFLAAKNHGLNPAGDPITQLHVIAEQSPEPLKNWLNLIATQSWKLIMDDTGRYIENNWRTTVASTYRSQLMNRYPFNQNSNQDVDLSQFVAFMGQPGTLNNFYQTLLKPFVNETDKKWQWKTFDNQRLPFSDLALDQIQHVIQVQRAFFPNRDNKLYIPFTLEPVSIDAHMKNFNLNINGQQVAYQKERAPRLLSWPGTNNTQHSTTLNFVTPSNQLASNVLKGDWGWFRLVSQSTRQVVTPKQLLLDFNFEGKSAKYVLYTQGNINPFLPQNLVHIELPERLTV